MMKIDFENFMEELFLIDIGLPERLKNYLYSTDRSERHLKNKLKKKRFIKFYKLLSTEIYKSNQFGLYDVLDFGCGTGILTNYLALNGYTTFMCDIDSAAIEIANYRAKSLGLNLSLYNKENKINNFLIVSMFAVMESLKHTTDVLDLAMDARQIIYVDRNLSPPFFRKNSNNYIIESEHIFPDFELLNEYGLTVVPSKIAIIDNFLPSTYPSIVSPIVLRNLIKYEVNRFHL